MRNRIARLGLGTALALLVASPMTATSHAWSCQDEVAQVACLVVGTTCRAVDGATGYGELCTFE